MPRTNSVSLIAIFGVASIEGLAACSRSAPATVGPPGTVPRNWQVVDPTAGAGGWARRVLDPRTNTTFVLIEPGTFTMGSPSSEPGRFAVEPLHTVSITKPFFLADTETTADQWQTFRYGTRREYDDVQLDCPPTRVSKLGRKGCPATSISWEDASAYCDHFGYRLPTEAEWEYAARAGTHTAFWWGGDPDDGEGKGNVHDEDQTKVTPGWEHFRFSDGYAGPAPVQSFEPNPWGLYDMLGNVWEWCADSFSEDPSALPSTDPLAIGGSGVHVLRGGSWRALLQMTRCAWRANNFATAREDHFGFRAAFEPAATASAAPKETKSEPLKLAWLADAQAIFGTCLTKHEQVPATVGVFRTSDKTLVTVRIVSVDSEASSVWFRWGSVDVPPEMEMLLTHERKLVNLRVQPRLAGSRPASLEDAEYDEFTMPAKYNGKIQLDYKIELETPAGDVVREGALVFDWPGT